MNEAEENHSNNNKAFQSFLETVPLPWHNVFAITILNQNDDSNLNIVDADAIPANIETLYDDSGPGADAEHTQPQYDTRKRKVSSTDLPSNSSFTVRKYNRESAEDIRHLLETIIPMEKRDSNSDENFFNGIFDDIAVTEQKTFEESSLSTTRTDAEPCSSITRTKTRLMKSSNLTRSQESFVNLSNMDLSLVTASTNDSSTDLSLSSITEPISTEQQVSEKTTSRNIPASVSISTCSSADNLSQTSSMPGGQGSENSSIIYDIDGNKSNMNDVYGWFVEMDKDDIFAESSQC